MPLYEYECPQHGRFDIQHSMSEVGEPVACWCRTSARRVFTAPYFQEDRVRQFQNTVDGTKFDYVLGQQRPETRREYYKELDRIGAEPVSRATEPAQWKEGREYAEHVKHGGQRDKGFEKAPHPDSKPGNLTVLKQLQQSGVKIP
jgi:putative FmdB family regulatory protein